MKPRCVDIPVSPKFRDRLKKKKGPLTYEEYISGLMEPDK